MRRQLPALVAFAAAFLSSLIYLVPVTSGLLSVAFLGERLDWPKAAGALLVLLGVRPRHPAARAREEPAGCCRLATSAAPGARRVGTAGRRE